MGMTIIEKILSAHSKYPNVKPGDIIDVEIDVRVARDFGGANVVKNIEENKLGIKDPSKTFFTFDTNPTGSDQKYAANQQICRVFARKHGIKVYDIDAGIGTHTLIDEGLAWPGSTSVSTDSHANILGAIGAFGQGMGDKDIAAAWANGAVWFKVPPSVKLVFEGKRPEHVTAKDIVLNLLNQFGANGLLGTSIELYGEGISTMSLDERLTISSMATEMGAVAIILPPNQAVLEYCSEKTGRKAEAVLADAHAIYQEEHTIDISKFKTMISRPGKPHDSVDIQSALKTKIDSAFLGSCTNGRIEDLRAAANILKGRRIAPGVVMKIVPATDAIWQQAMAEGLFTIFKQAGALVSNAGCAGCAAGQVGQNGPGEITVSTGNRNFPGKQGKGEVYLASPEIVSASAVAGYITTPDAIPQEPALFETTITNGHPKAKPQKTTEEKKQPYAQGRAWFIREDNIDTDMIFHNRYLSITNIDEMGQYAFDNLEGYEDFAKRVRPGDIIVVQKNFGSGSSRQQAVDCFKALGVSCILAESFGAIYERNAINAAMPITTYQSIEALNLENGDELKVDYNTGLVENLSKQTHIQAQPFSDVQLEIYLNGGLF